MENNQKKNLEKRTCPQTNGNHDTYCSEYTPPANQNYVDVRTPEEIANEPESTITTSTPPANDWERKVDDELYFLTQDGYAGEWSEQKKEEIKKILRQERERWLEEAVQEVRNIFADTSGKEYERATKLLQALKEKLK